MSFDRGPSDTDPVPVTIPHVGKVLCQYCHNPYNEGQGLTNHERGCQLNPARRERKPQKRKKCPKCRTLISIGQFDRHVPKCKGRSTEAPPIEVVAPVKRTVLGAETTSDGSVTELLVELLFPDGMPNNATFVRALRTWLDATDQLVALADLTQ